MRLPFGEMRSNSYTCCFCCHVRLGTVLVGIISLVVDLLAIVIGIMLMSNSQFYQQLNNEVGYPLLYDNDEINASNLSVADTNSTLWLTNCSDDRFVGLILTIGSAMLTIGLLYGTIKGYPRYLLPYFCLQVFDFCVTSLAVIGYFSYTPNLKLWLMKQTWMPLRSQLLSLDTTWLLLIAAVVSILILWLKAYCIGVVWNCYKFLCQAQGQSHEARRRRYDIELVHFEGSQPTDFMPSLYMEASEHMNAANVMVLPPKYEDLEDSSGSSEPPSYSTACENK